MSEIEKLMQNAGVEYYDRYFSCIKDKDLVCQDDCEICDDAEEIKCYPPFTAEKQLNLIKWLANNKDIEISEHFMDLKIKRTYCVSRRGSQFEESLAELVNLIWQSLTYTEKGEIRRILE